MGQTRKSSGRAKRVRIAPSSGHKCRRGVGPEHIQSYAIKILKDLGFDRHRPRKKGGERTESDPLKREYRYWRQKLLKEDGTVATEETKS